jgi:hypothetical protein
MNCHIIMDAYMDAYVGNDVTILAHLLTAQHQSHSLACFKPICNLFSAHLHSGFSPFFNLIF